MNIETSATYAPIPEEHANRAWFQRIAATAYSFFPLTARPWLISIGLYLAALVFAKLLLASVGATPAAAYAFLIAILAAAWLAGSGPGLLVCALTFYVTPLILTGSQAAPRVQSQRFALTVLVSLLVSHVARTNREKTNRIQQRLAAIVESSDDAIISKDLNGIVLTWNRGAERLFGYKAEEMIGKPVSTLAPPGRADEMPTILERISRGERVDHFDTKRRTKDGRILTVSLCVSPLRDSSGTIVGASKIARDMTERDQVEHALSEANAALSRSNADLEHFAYSASHDLQEPLRMVATYSEMLRRRFGGQLGPSGDQYINYTIEGALRMERLIKDLLAYTHASRDDQEPPPQTSSEEVLRRVLEGMRSTIAESGATVTHSDLPVLAIHRFQLEQILQNLIGNAIRYRGQSAPQIHVGAAYRVNEWVFSVKDNGIGIDPRYKEQIFGMFKRLHASSDYPGTGMGLAICQRIVQRLGGRIWVESEPGYGATFFFTVPE